MKQTQDFPECESSSILFTSNLMPRQTWRPLFFLNCRNAGNVSSIFIKNLNNNHFDKTVFDKS